MASFLQLAVTTSALTVLASSLSGDATSAWRGHFGSPPRNSTVAAHIALQTEWLGPEGDAQGGAIVSSALAPRRWWGFPNYARDLDNGPPTWPELARRHGHLGRACKMETAKRQCGTVYVCRNEACQQCQQSRDCGEKYACVPYTQTTSLGVERSHSVCIPRDPVNKWTWREIVCTILIVITAILSAAAGMGGGGVYVPLLLLLLQFSTKEAVPLSQAMIAGGATVNVVMFCRDMQFNPLKIDFEVVMMLNPGLAAGVTVGIMLHVISPQWLIVVILLVTLVIAFEKSWTKGIKQWREESKKAKEEQRKDAEIGTGGRAPGGDVSALAPQAPVRKQGMGLVAVATKNQRAIGLIICCWVTFLLYTKMKAAPCSLTYWLQLFGVLVACGIFTAAGATTIAADQTGGYFSDPRSLWQYPLFAVAAGLCGGFLGIGGGIIMGPMLLELGLPAPVIQGTTAMFVFLSASLATIQFIALDKNMPAYALWFTSWVILATIVGQIGTDYALRLYNRPSVIVLSIAGIVACSMVMMGGVGSIDIVNDLMRGASGMGFAPMHLCHP